ncbi:MAG: thioesterase family protein [Pseudomonadota bacterium]
MTEQAFIYLFRVRYAECDPQGVVFNGRYVEYADVAFTEYIRTLFGGYQQVLELGVDFQVVNLNVAWKSPARADDVLRARVWTEKIGNTSVNLKMTLCHHESGRHIADIDLIYVVVTPSEYTKMPVPDSVRETLLLGAPNVVINHAGEIGESHN